MKTMLIFTLAIAIMQTLREIGRKRKPSTEDEVDLLTTSISTVIIVTVVMFLAGWFMYVILDVFKSGASACEEPFDQGLIFTSYFIAWAVYMHSYMSNKIAKDKDSRTIFFVLFTIPVVIAGLCL